MLRWVNIRKEAAVKTTNNLSLDRMLAVPCPLPECEGSTPWQEPDFIWSRLAGDVTPGHLALWSL